MALETIATPIPVCEKQQRGIFKELFFSGQLDYALGIAVAGAAIIAGLAIEYQRNTSEIQRIISTPIQYNQSR